MKAFTQWVFKPNHQREGKPEVEFDLRPLDQRTFYSVQLDIQPMGVGLDGAIAAFEFGVVGWRGLEIEYSEAAKRATWRQVADKDWAIWHGEIAAALYLRCLRPETEAKNS